MGAEAGGCPPGQEDDRRGQRVTIGHWGRRVTPGRWGRRVTPGFRDPQGSQQCGWTRVREEERQRR